MRKFALFSTFNKEGIASLAGALTKMGMELLATGKTKELLEQEGFKVTEVSELTGEPERFGGRLKTLHHKILGAILLRPGLDDSEWPFDFRISAVVCNFYPFTAKAKEIQPLPELIEWIDIGGPTMVRAAAKNYQHVWIFTHPKQFSRFIASPAHSSNPLEDTNSEKDFVRMRERFAMQAFEAVRQLDESIYREFQYRHVPNSSNGELVYGENPHQRAEFCPNIRAGVKTYGKLSFNNIRDAEGALKFVLPFANPAVSIVKHQTLCGAASGLANAPLEKVFEWAWEGDTVSRFGSVIGFNFIPPPAVDEILLKKFIEVLVLPRSPDSERWAERMRAQKEKLRIVLVEKSYFGRPASHQEVFGGLMGELLQESDPLDTTGSDKSPEVLLEKFGVWAAACSKSNAMVLAGFDETHRCAYMAGAGQGQPNRIDALKLLAIPRAREFAQRREISFEKLACFSDAFLPFADNIEALAQAGLRKIFQPGGSKNDGEVQASAQRLGVDMTLTGQRHFWH